LKTIPISLTDAPHRLKGQKSQSQLYANQQRNKNTRPLPDGPKAGIAANRLMTSGWMAIENKLLPNLNSLMRELAETGASSCR
jgi:hypothetical protein